MHLNTRTHQTDRLTKAFSWELYHLQTLSCVLQRFSISRCLVARGESFHWLSLFFKSSTVLKTTCSKWLSWQRGYVLPSTRHLTYLSAKYHRNTEKKSAIIIARKRNCFYKCRLNICTVHLKALHTLAPTYIPVRQIRPVQKDRRETQKGSIYPAWKTNFVPIEVYSYSEGSH